VADVEREEDDLNLLVRGVEGVFAVTDDLFNDLSFLESGSVFELKKILNIIINA